MCSGEISHFGRVIALSSEQWPPLLGNWIGFLINMYWAYDGITRRMAWTFAQRGN